MACASAAYPKLIETSVNMLEAKDRNVIWLLPLVAVPIGAIFFVRYMRAIKKPDHDLAEDLVVATGPAAPADLGHYIEEIEAELNDE